MNRKRIVLLGSSEAAMAVAFTLGRELSPVARDSASLHWVALENVAPQAELLPAVAGGRWNPDDAAVLLASTDDPWQHHRAEAVAIDHQRKELHLQGPGVRAGFSPERLLFDELVVALDAPAGTVGVLGAADHGIQLAKIGDAIGIRSRVLAACEAADLDDSPRRRRALCHFVVVGSGEAACHLAGQVHSLAHQLAAQFRQLKSEDIEVALLCPSDDLLPHTSVEIGAFAQRELEAQGVRVRKNARVVQVAEDHLQMNRGMAGNERLESRNVLWCEGSAPPPAIESLVGAQRDGKITVDGDFRAQGQLDTFVVGPWAATGNGLAEADGPRARRQGTYVARALLHSLGCGPAPTLRKPSSTIALALGPKSSVVRLFGVLFGGLWGWLLWWAVTRLQSPEHRHRWSTFLSGAIAGLFPKTPLPMRLRSSEKPLYLTPLPGEVIALQPPQMAPTTTSPPERVEAAFEIADGTTLAAPTPPKPPPPPRSRPVPGTHATATAPSPPFQGGPKSLANEHP